MDRRCNFYITGCLKTMNVSRVVYKPTYDMQRDYFTKAVFYTHLKTTLLGLDCINDDVFYERYKHSQRLFMPYFIFITARTS